MSLKNKIIKGGFFLSLSNIFTQFLAIIVNVALARLLLPKDFGLIALTTTYIGFITIFTNIGFGSAIIYKKDATDNQISTLYWINFLFSFFSFLAITVSAPLASVFYNEPKLINVIWLTSISILFTPFFIIHYKIKERDLEFKLLSKVTVISTFIGSASAVFFAFLGYGVYALVAQIIISTFIKMILILIASTWKPKWIFNYKEVKNMIWYSVKFKTAQGMLYAERNIDYLILGRLFAASILGFYAFAYNIMYTPVKRISYIFSDVLFPSFSSFKGDTNKIIKGYFQSVQIISMVSFPAMALLAFNADSIIPFIFGVKWNEAIPIVQILSFAGAVQSISQLGGVIFSSIGKPEVNIYIAIARTVLVITAIVWGSFYGILMVAYFILIVKTISFFIMMATIFYFIKYSFLQFLNYIKGPIISILLLSVFQFALSNSIVHIDSITKLITMSFIAVIVIILFHSAIIKELYTTIKSKSVA